MMIDTKKLKEYLQCDDAFLVEVINNFLEESKEMIGRLKDGAKEGDHEQIGAAAHKMLSSTRILDLSELTEVLEQIQKDADEKKSVDEIQPNVNEAMAIWSKTKEGVIEVKENLQLNMNEH